MPKNFLFNVRSLKEAEDLMSTLFRRGHFTAQSAEINFSRNIPKKRVAPTLMLTGFLDDDPSSIYLYLISTEYDENTPKTIKKILDMAGFIFDANNLFLDTSLKPNDKVAFSLQKS